MWLLALAPTALFLIAPFSESSFIAAAAASLYYARAGQSRKAIVAGALACAFRLTGLALIPALAIEQLRRSGWRPRPDLLLVLALLLPLALYARVHAGPHRRRAGAARRRQARRRSVSSPRRPGPGSPRPGTRSSAPPTARRARSSPARSPSDCSGSLLCVGMWASSRIPRSLRPVLHHRVVDDRIAAVLALAAPLHPRAVPGGAARRPISPRGSARARPAILAASGVLMCAGTWIFAQGRWLG